MFHPRSHNKTQKPGSSVWIISLEIPLGKTFSTMLAVTEFKILSSDISFCRGSNIWILTWLSYFHWETECIPYKKTKYCERVSAEGHSLEQRTQKKMYKNIASWPLEKIQRKSTVWMNQSNNNCEQWKTGAFPVIFQLISTYITRNPTVTPKQKHKAKPGRFNMTTKEKICSWFIDGHLVSIKW